MKRRRAVVYLRDSTERVPFSRQLRRNYRRWAECENLRIVGWYWERASHYDNLEERPRFRRLVADGRRGRFEVIMCDRTETLAEFYSIETALAVADLRAAGVELLTFTNGYVEWERFVRRLAFPGKHRIRRDSSNQTVGGRTAPVFWIVHSLDAID